METHHPPRFTCTAASTKLWNSVKPTRPTLASSMMSKKRTTWKSIKASPIGFGALSLCVWDINTHISKKIPWRPGINDFNNLATKNCLRSLYIIKLNLNIKPFSPQPAPVQPPDLPKCHEVLNDTKQPRFPPYPGGATNIDIHRPSPSNMANGEPELSWNMKLWHMIHKSFIKYIVTTAIVSWFGEINEIPLRRRHWSHRRLNCQIWGFVQRAVLVGIKDILSIPGESMEKIQFPLTCNLHHWRVMQCCSKWYLWYLLLSKNVSGWQSSIQFRATGKFLQWRWNSCKKLIDQPYKYIEYVYRIDICIIINISPSAGTSPHSPPFPEIHTKAALMLRFLPAQTQKLGWKQQLGTQLGWWYSHVSTLWYPVSPWNWDTKISTSKRKAIVLQSLIFL